MGIVRVDIEIESPARRGEQGAHESVLVNTAAELSWVPAELFESLGIARYAVWRFRQTDGSVTEQPAGEPGDLILLGAGSLEGLNLRLEPVTMQPGLPYTSVLAANNSQTASTSLSTGRIVAMSGSKSSG